MKKIIIILLTLTLTVPQGLDSVALAEDNGDKPVSQVSEIVWDGYGDSLKVKGNDTVIIKNTADGTLNVPKNSTITIIGKIKRNKKNIELFIESGAKVRWAAEYRGTDNLIGVSGKGTFEVIDGALIENINGKCDTVSSSDKKLSIVVSGGVMRTKGGWGSSIFSIDSDVTINGGLVENAGDNGASITCRNITINGGKVSALKETYMAIHAAGVKENGKNDPANGNVIMLGGVVSSSNHTAIDGSGTVYVKGGTVTSTGEDATITGGYNEYGGIKVSGGTVTSTCSDCLLSNNTSVSGGVVYASKGHALVGSSDSGAKALSNRIVQTKSSSKSKARVSGGLILARGKNLSDVIDTTTIKVSNSNNRGIICTWNKKGKTKYTKGTKTNLKIYTSKASVKWSRKGKLSGLSYKRGSNKGFVRVKGVNVVNPKPKKTQFKYSLKSKKYDGKRKSISITAKKGTGKITAVYYQGTDGTKYKKSKKAPKKVGTYKVTINVKKSNKYRSVKGLNLGKFKIRKAG